MSKFRKNEEKPAPAINTSSLPDIVFMLLFFFMVATTTKEVDPLVKINSAQGAGVTDLTPFKQRGEVDFVYLGEQWKVKLINSEKELVVKLMVSFRKMELTELEFGKLKSLEINRLK